MYGSQLGDSIFQTAPNIIVWLLILGRVKNIFYTISIVLAWLTIAVRYLWTFGNVMCCSHHKMTIDKAKIKERNLLLLYHLHCISKKVACNEA